MTGQLLMSASAASLSSSQNLVGGSNATGMARAGSTAASNISSSSRTRLVELTKTLDQANHQAEFLHLQAETEALLLQLQLLKQKRSHAAQLNLHEPDAIAV